MARPPVIDHYPWERHADLLEAESRRLKSLRDWKGFGLLVLGGIMLLAEIVVIGSLFTPLFF